MRSLVTAAFLATAITLGGAASADDAAPPAPAPAPEAAPPPPPPKLHPTNEVDFGGHEPGDKQRLLGGLVGAAGFITAAVGIFQIISSKALYDEAKSRCGSAPLCQASDVADSKTAHSRADVGGWLMLGGLAVVGGGVALYFTAPRVKKPLAVAPGVGSLTLTGTF